MILDNLPLDGFAEQMPQTSDPTVDCCWLERQLPPAFFVYQFSLIFFDIATVDAAEQSVVSEMSFDAMYGSNPRISIKASLPILINLRKEAQTTNGRNGVGWTAIATLHTAYELDDSRYSDSIASIPTVVSDNWFSVYGSRRLER